MNKTVDYIVVGSGCSGAMAAQTLVGSGAEVLMVDVGNWNDSYEKLVPDKNFLELRRTDNDQYRYLIGERAEGVPWGDVGKGAQVTPTRHHMTQDVDRLTPMRSDTFSPIESLGYGGLGIGWGLQCWEFSSIELERASLPSSVMEEAYEVIAGRIGISATKDSASAYTMGSLKTFQPSPHMDRNHRRIYQKYTSRQSAFNDKGVYVGRTPLALLTKDKGSRRKYAYRDTDFYADNRQSAWRPWMTVNKLKKRPNFNYLGQHLVLSFEEKQGIVHVRCLRTSDQEQVTLRCRKLVLGAGSMASARIALRSLKNEPDYITKLPLLCNPYTYIPCLQPSMFGKGVEDEKLGFAQLTLFLDESKGKGTADLCVASLYTYQSLMLFRVVRQLPFNFVDSTRLLQYLLPGMVIMGVHHPDEASPEKYVQLVADKDSPTGDRLDAEYKVDATTKAKMDRREKTCIAAMRGMGCFALKRINPGYGSSVHYAGTLPYSDAEKPYTLAKDGRLHGTKQVYVADSSGFTFLPAKGLTFTILANAHRVAEGLLKHE